MLRTPIAILSLTAVLVILPAQSALAGPKLVVDSPVRGMTVAGKQPIRARLDGGSRSRVISARFFVQGQLVSSDLNAPFTLARGATLDTRQLPAGPNRLKFRATYLVRRPGGKLDERTVRKSVRVHVFQPPSPSGIMQSSRWKPIFSDDFSSAALSQSKWHTQRDDWIKRGIPYSNLEGAGYLPSNVGVANGSLRISTSQNNSPGFPQSTGSVNTNKRFSFKYGYIESRILVPACSGCWPAFWMLPSADHWPPEIDIIEFFDTSEQVIPYSAVHWPVPGPEKEDLFSQRLQLSDFDNYVGTWHTYGVLWTRRTVQFYVDGHPGPRFDVRSRIPHLPMYPIIQLAVGAGHRPADGSTMQVDHVRAWRRAG